MRFTGFQIGKGLIILSLIVPFRATGFAQTIVRHPAEILLPVAYDVTPPLAAMPIIQEDDRNLHGEREVPNQGFSYLFNPNQDFAKSLPEPDPVLQAAPGPYQTNSTLVNRDGIGNYLGYIPPDAVGDIGTNHYIQAVNAAFAVYSKSGAVLYGPVSLATLWQGFPLPHTSDGDPVVLYDHLADRWLITQFSLPNFPFGPFYELIAVSTTSNPLGSWYRYSYKFNTFPDYPKLGVWTNGYYMSVNMYATAGDGGIWMGPAAIELERDSLLNGKAGRMVIFQLGVNDNHMLPADLDGPPPGAQTPGLFLGADDQPGTNDRLVLYKLTNNWLTPQNAKFTGPAYINVAPFDGNLCNDAQACIPQAGTSGKLDPLSRRMMNRLQYRNFGSYKVLMANHTVDVDGSDHAGVRWYELRASDTTFSVYQQGTYAIDANHRWLGSIAMDGNGNIALGYSVSGSTMFPAIRATGRRAGDPPGQMSFMEEQIIAGGGVQTSTINRWGDYSCLTVDPVDDRTFWYTNEYYASSGFDTWKTRIASFTIDNLPVSNKKYTETGYAFNLKCYPNPVTKLATINWNLKTEGFVELNIYDFTGRKTETLVHSDMVPGINQVVYDASDLPAGMYFCQLRVNGVAESIEIIIAR